MRKFPGETVKGSHTSYTPVHAVTLVTWARQHALAGDQSPEAHIPSVGHCNFAYSAFAAMRIGILGSAFFHSVRKS